MHSGKIHSKQTLKTWENMELRFYPSLFILPAVAIDQSKIPVLWSLVLAGFGDAMNAIAQYGLHRVVNESDKAYFCKYQKSER